MLLGAVTYAALQMTEPIGVELKPDVIALPPFSFFSPEGYILKYSATSEVWVFAPQPQDWINALLSIQPETLHASVEVISPAVSGLSKQAYLQRIQTLQQHILDGDVYEANLSRNIRLQAKVNAPGLLFPQWLQWSEVPFAAYVRMQEVYIYSASPERFLAYREGLCISQPIKGTAPRSADPEKDAALSAALLSSEKDRAENLMIVDLVRNDLNRTCKPGSVIVSELCGLHSFPLVHHLISTISGELKPEYPPFESFLHAFPPGSMTGAPKVRAMQIINELEPEGRGIFAGAIGYIESNTHFDFNVVIRTLVYDASREIMSYHAGGAITIDSDPEEEYAETLSKAKGLFRFLGIDPV
jgi:para-aminobenzoate synthetase component 1